MAVQTWVARFVVDHGQVTEQGGRLRTFQRRRLDEPEADLHLLAEPSGPNAEELGAQALDAIGRLFLNDPLSLTGGLVRAIRETHRTLLDWNRRSVAREHVLVGLTAAITRGSLVYLCQAGPVAAYLKRGASLQRLQADEGQGGALGAGEIEPVVRRIELGPGDLLLAASRSLAARIDDGTLEALLTRGGDQALSELYLLTRDLPAFALFLVIGSQDSAVEVAGDPEAGFEPPPGPASAREAGSPPLSFEGHAPQGPAAGGGPALTSPPPLDISRPVVRLRRDQIGGRADYPRTTGSAARLRLDLPRPQVFAVLLGAALVFLLAAFTVPDLVRENRQERASNLTEGAALQLLAAQAESEPGRKRLLLEEARRLAGEAARIEPEDEYAVSLHQQAAAALKVLDAVVAVDPQTLTTLSRQVTGVVSVQRIVVGGSRAYLLDVRGRRVLALPLNPTGVGAPTVVYEDGQSYGGVTARRPEAIAWDPAGGRLFVVDAERKLFEVSAGGAPRQVPLRRSSVWSSFADIAVYDGNLYVLDPKGGQVHRYLPAEAGYDSEPGRTLAGTPDLSTSVSLAVDVDVLVLDANGRVRRFSGGRETAFSLGGIDRGLLSPTSIAISPADEEIVIADAGNKRIVVADREGRFRRQLVSSAFTDLRAIAVDPSGQRLLAVAGDAVLAVALR